VRTRRRAVGIVLAVLVLLSCSSDEPISFDAPAGDTDPSTTSTPPDDVDDDALVVSIDTAAPGQTISPLIRGVSGDLSADEKRRAGVTLDSWGGNPSSRYNYQLGNAWNAGSDWEFRNTDYGNDGDVFDAFAEANRDFAVRLAVPTLGWIPKNGDDNTCSFPEGGCTGGDGYDCENPGPIADPNTTSVPSTPEMVADWIAGLGADGLAPRFIAMDNEPELWGHTHYDIHPTCPTFQEIVDTYLRYADAIRDVAPEAELMGPAMCCWFDYWRIAPDPPDGSDADFLTWFLTKVREHDEATGRRTLDVVDVHFYPQSEVFNDETDDETNARRLRSTRALWDPSYVDESWINDTIALVPRLRAIIGRSYPDTPLAVTEWNFGADGTMNGALAIADVLGIYGREGVYAAAYWRSPDVGSPGYYAFTMHGNYDGRGSAFEGAVVPTKEDDNLLSTYAAVDEDTGLLRVMLLNEDPEEPRDVRLDVAGRPILDTARRWTYDGSHLDRIVADQVDATGSIELAPYSITVLELDLGAT
jgi:glycosyl hydrolase family 44